MKQQTKVKLFLIIIIIIGLVTSNVRAASVSIKAETDTTDVLSNKIVYINLSLTNFIKIDENDDMAISGNIEYDNQIFKKVEIESINGWTSEFNEDSGKFVADTSTTIENQIITRFKLTIADNISTFNTQIKFNNISITNNDDLDLNNLNLTINVTASNVDQDDNGNQQESTVDNNNQQNQEEKPSTDDSNDNSSEEDNNINDEENNNEIEISEEKEANNIEQVGDLTVAKEPIPQTGFSFMVLGIIAFVILIGVISLRKYKKIVRLINKGV